jgi:sterol desaturase/sphingolipid hydroxylase (fatty acid hydroxylase superfamily)
MWLSHADIAPTPKISRSLSYLIVTAAFHRHHHSANQPETNSNYGEVLTIWDRLFGSLSGASGDIERIGLGDAHDKGADSLIQQLLLPFRPNPVVVNPTTPSVPHSADR